MTDTTGWRRVYDTVERAVSARIEALVHSDEFAHMTAVITLAMFSSLGFTGEALLRDHIRIATGNCMTW